MMMKRKKLKEVSKTTSVDLGDSSWYKGEKNPDFRLVQINAANEGFQAKMSPTTGSYMLTKIIARIRQNLSNNKLRLGPLLDEVQEELQEKQLMEMQFNNNTNNIKFHRHSRNQAKSLTASNRGRMHSDTHQHETSIELHNIPAKIPPITPLSEFPLNTYSGEEDAFENCDIQESMKKFELDDGIESTQHEDGIDNATDVEKP